MKMPFIFSLIIVCYLLPLQPKAQLVSISGTVKNASDGEVKRNATVFESVSGIGTITNSQGYYKLLLTPGQQKLEISSAGFQEYSSIFYLTADTVISVELIPRELSQRKEDIKKEPEFQSYDTEGFPKHAPAPGY